MAGDTNQSVKCLLCEHGDLSSGPQQPYEKPGILTYTPGLGTEVRGSLGLGGQPNQWVPSSVSTYTSYSIRWKAIEENS